MSSRLNTWLAIEAELRPKSMEVYRNGSRNSVALYGERVYRHPLIFGTGGGLSDEEGNFKELFMNSHRFKIIPYPRRDTYLISVDPFDANINEVGTSIVYKKSKNDI